MTSANTIEYTIFNKEGKEVGRHRQNLMCMRNNDGLDKFIPASDFTIKSWGYDEDDEYWEEDEELEEETLEQWLLKNKASITSKLFEPGDIINVRKVGKCEVIERFDIFEKGQNWFPIYTVKLESGEIVDIDQNKIIP